MDVYELGIDGCSNACNAVFTISKQHQRILLCK